MENQKTTSQRKQGWRGFVLLGGLALALGLAWRAPAQAPAAPAYDPKLYKAMAWREIGPFRGGRSVAVTGHPQQPYTYYFGATGGGVWKTEDGGLTWINVSDGFFKNGSVGALAVAESDPNVIYVGMGETCIRGNVAPGDGVYKSTDGGDTWTDLTNNPGMPKGVKGKIGVTVSPARPERVWALVEAEDGGLFRSDDGGKNWRRVNEDRRLRQRAWYYTHVFADSKSPETVYVLNVQFLKSVDGGKTFNPIAVPHGDNHALWIDPNNPLRMISGDDGGAIITYNGGQTWTRPEQATAQFYHVVVDQQFPYHVYGAQQDNSTIDIVSRAEGPGIDRTDWHPVGGGESGYIAVNAADPNIVYAGSYGGYLTRYDHRTGQMQNISPWPDNPMGAGAGGLKYRFQWTYPIVASPHDAHVLYATANQVFKSTNEGMSWQVISPDLTRNDKSKLGPSGGPITKDNTSVEYYGTIFTFAESPVRKGVLWAGSDDGLVHVSQDGGAHWQNVTPKGVPEWALMSIIEASPHDAATAYAAATRYKLDDFSPYLYKTNDYGKTWKKITDGIPAREYTRVVREDPHRRGLLYAGTEKGVYVSFDDGGRWQPLQLNLPVVPIHDLAVQPREKDLVAATHGRSFWILDDLTPLYQINDQVAKADVYLFPPREAYRMRGFGFNRPGLALGKNPPNGAVIYYYFKDKPPTEVKVDILDGQSRLIKSFTSKAEKKEGEEAAPPPAEDEFFGGGAASPKVPAEAGMNRFVWDLRYPDATAVPGALFWAGNIRGPVAVPGSYQVRLTVGDKTLTQPFTVKKDARVATTADEFQAQFDLLIKIQDKLSAAHEAVNTIRSIRQQTDDLVKRLGDHPAKKAIEPAAKALNGKLSAVEEEIIQVKVKSSQDTLNYPIKLNNKLAALAGVVASADARPTQASYEVFDELSQKLDAQLAQLKAILSTDLPAFDRLVKEQDLAPVILKSGEKH